MPDDASRAQQDIVDLVDLELTGCTTWAARPMAEWRERGYVPDSDDEDEISQSAARRPNPPFVPDPPHEHAPDFSKEGRTPGEPGVAQTTVPSDNRYNVSSQQVENLRAGDERLAERELLHLDSTLETVAVKTKEQGPSSDEPNESDTHATDTEDPLLAASVSDQLHATLEYGLQSVQEVLGNAHMGERSVPANRSETSSPLSSIRSFANEDDIRQDADDGMPAPVHSSRQMTTEPQSWCYRRNSPPRYSGRDLRRRHPIQLHPYALEDARYQQELKARGLQPLRIAPGSAGTHRNLVADNTQGPDLLSSSPMRDSAEYESFPNLRSAEHSQSGLSSIVNRAGRRSTSPADSGEDDLPDLSTLLKGEFPGLRAGKRRKLAHKAAKQAEQPSEHDDFHVPELPPADSDHIHYDEMEIDMFNVPPSPPRTGSSVEPNTFLVPSKMSGQNALNTPQRPLPTPAASSLIKPYGDPQLNEQSEQGFAPVAADIRHGRGIQSLQRRIKGVLPASWLTLDRHDQTRKESLIRPPPIPPAKQPGVKGVARRVRTDRPQTSHAENSHVHVIESSDEHSSQTAFSPSAKTRDAWASGLFEEDDDFEVPWDDVVEDNGISTTTPQRSGSGKRARVSATKRQQTLNESFNTSRTSHVPRTGLLQTGSKRKKQSASSHQIQQRPEPRHREPGPVPLRLGILGVPDLVQLPIEDQPQFLRVAARQARICRNRTLRPRLDYQLSPHVSKKSISSTKPNNTANYSHDQLDSLKSSTAATIHRILVRQVGTAASATRENKTLPRPSSTRTDSRTRATSGSFVRQLAGPASASLPTRLLSYYRNRSGKGRLISSLAQARQPRSAQVETAQPRTAHLLEQSLNLCPPEANTAQFKAKRKRVPQHRKTLPRFSPSQPPPEAQNCATLLEESETPPLMAGIFYHESTLIGSGDVAKTIQKIAVTPRNLDAATLHMPSINVQMDKLFNILHSWGAWNPSVASQFKKVFKNLLDECPLVMTADYESLTPLLPDLMLYMRTIITYNNDVLYFEDATARASFVTTCLEVLEDILHVVQLRDDEKTLPPQLEDNMLHLLNHLAVLSFQVSYIVLAPTIKQDFVRALDLFEEVIRRMLSLALSTQGLAKLWESHSTNNAKLFHERGIRTEFPQIDALVIASHLCRWKLTGESCSEMVGQILAKRVAKHPAALTNHRLSEVNFFIRMILPYAAFDASGVWKSRVPTAEESSHWEVIVSVFDAFLKSRIRAQDTHGPHNFASRRYIQDCLRLAVEWGWIECAGLVNLLRIHYGNNEMDALFADLGSNSRTYLDNFPEDKYIYPHSPSDSGFDTLLKLIIVSGQQKAGRKEKASRQSSFIFSLAMNSGQVLRKDEDHDLQVLEPIQNRHDLYTVLYYISSVETKIRLLHKTRNLVDFSESHLSACKISLKTLVRLIRFQISTDEEPSMLHMFAKWVQEMIQRMLEQFDVAKLAASEQTVGGLSGGNVPSDVARITRFNQKQIQDFLVSILRAWSYCLQSCVTATQARYLMFGDNLEAVMKLCTRTIAINAVEGDDMIAFRDEVVGAMLSVLRTYINTWLPETENPRDLVENLQKVLRTVLSTQLGRYDQCSGEILHSLTYCWHALAKMSVDDGYRSWHHYLFQGGCNAWHAFDDTWHKRQYEVLFAALFVESLREEISYTLDKDLMASIQNSPIEWASSDMWIEWQVPMLQLWIGSLLVPADRFKFQADLTTEIMQFEAPLNPLMSHLPLPLYEDGVLVKLDLDKLIAARTALVLTLLRNMNELTTRPDSQSLFTFGPTKAECSAIVQNMMALMKQYLAELEEDSAEQAVYAKFVRRVLLEMRIHTTHLEPVPDDFEYKPGKYLTATDDVLLKLSQYKQQMVENGLEKHMVVYFHTTAERAAVSGQQEKFLRQLLTVFMNLTPEALSDTQGHAADARFRTLFFQNVFPAYLDRIFDGSGSIVARPVLECILAVYENLPCIYGFWTKERLEPFIIATLSLLVTFKTTLVSPATSPQRILSEPEKLNTFTILCALMYHILRRCHEMEVHFGTIGVLPDIWEYFLFFYKYTLKIAIRPPRLLPQTLVQEDLGPELKEPTLSATDSAMLTYSKRELADILDSKWVKGPDGKWLVQKPGGRKDEARGAIALRSQEQEMGWMSHEADKYLRLFTALWKS